MILILAGAGLTLCAVMFAVSKKMRAHVKRAISTLKDAETTRIEKLLLVSAVLLIFSGGLVPGPLDEILGIALIAKVVRRVEKRKRNL